MKFPQISRFFSAALFLGFVGALVGINVFLAINQSAAPEVSVLTKPWDWAEHEKLAQIYWQQGQLGSATRELTIAGDVLGTNTYANQIQEWNSQPAHKEAVLSYWKSVSERFPNYRDAYVAMGTLNYELGNWSDAKSDLTRAISLDQYLTFPQQLLSLME